MISTSEEEQHALLHELADADAVARGGGGHRGGAADHPPRRRADRQRTGPPDAPAGAGDHGDPPRIGAGRAGGARPDHPADPARAGADRRRVGLGGQGLPLPGLPGPPRGGRAGMERGPRPARGLVRPQPHRGRHPRPEPLHPRHQPAPRAAICRRRARWPASRCCCWATTTRSAWRSGWSGRCSAPAAAGG